MKRIAQLVILLVLALTLSGCGVNKDLLDAQFYSYATIKNIDIDIIHIDKEECIVDNVKYYKVEVKPYIQLENSEYIFQNETMYYRYDLTTQEIEDITKTQYLGGIE